MRSACKFSIVILIPYTNAFTQRQTVRTEAPSEAENLSDDDDLEVFGPDSEDDAPLQKY